MISNLNYYHGKYIYYYKNVFNIIFYYLVDILIEFIKNYLSVNNVFYLLYSNHAIFYLLYYKNHAIIL